MRRIILGILSVIVIAGCSACNQMLRIEDISGIETIEYNKYLEDFNNDISRLGYETIDFSETKIRILEGLNLKGIPKGGMCQTGIAVRKNGKVNLAFDQYFKNNPNHIKKLVIYHEIGHCFLGLDHVNTRSIMSDKSKPLIFNQSDVVNDIKRLELVQEMLNNSNYK